LGKDPGDVLKFIVNPKLQKGFDLLQASSLLVVGNGKVKECILVPRNAFPINLALVLNHFFMEPAQDQGNERQKLN
jgi:hypothetical protein